MAVGDALPRPGQHSLNKEPGDVAISVSDSFSRVAIEPLGPDRGRSRSVSKSTSTAAGISAPTLLVPLSSSRDRRRQLYDTDVCGDLRQLGQVVMGAPLTIAGHFE